MLLNKKNTEWVVGVVCNEYSFGGSRDIFETRLLARSCQILEVKNNSCYGKIKKNVIFSSFSPVSYNNWNNGWDDFQ